MLRKFRSESEYQVVSIEEMDDNILSHLFKTIIFREEAGKRETVDLQFTLKDNSFLHFFCIG
jgi:hypothetical protein